MLSAGTDIEPVAAAAPVDRRYASRKFILAAAVLLAGFAGRALGLLTPELTVDLLKWTLGLYFGVNVAAAGVALLGSKS